MKDLYKLANKIDLVLNRVASIKYLPFLIVIVFSLSYLILALVKHYSFLSGYDLAIIDQVIWKYSQFKEPITTVHSFHGTSLLSDHIEIIYILISPSYWINSSAYNLLVFQVLAVTISGLAVYKLARIKKIVPSLSIALLLSYLSFYGFQNAIWADTHSLVFAVGFLAWFVYFLEKRDFKFALLFFILSILCKEDIALLTFLISGTYFIFNRKKDVFIFVVLSILYLGYIFLIHYPYLTQDGYRYANPNGILSEINPHYMIDTQEKRAVIAYSLAWFGFIPLLSPLHLIPAAGDLAHYFVLGQSQVSAAQGLFLHYRSSLALLLIWPTIIVLSKYKRLNNSLIAVYMLICAAFLQYYLHLPLSYLSKSWFWNIPSATKDINELITMLPEDASVVSQNNITPHITHRDNIYTLWSESKEFSVNSPCGEDICKWFRWGGNPEYLIIDTSESWDARHFLASREDFISGVENLKKEEIISEHFKINNAIIYKINKNP